MASNVSSRFGWGQEGGCYVLLDGSHAGHEWNRLPDGRIIDTTADQFGESSPGIRIATAADARYIRDCYCSV